MTAPGQPLDLAPIQAALSKHPRTLDVIANGHVYADALLAEVLRLREILDQRTGDIADRALENAALRSRLDAVHDTCDDIEAEVNGATSDDTTYGGHITRIRNAAGFRTSP